MCINDGSSKCYALIGRLWQWSKEDKDVTVSLPTEAKADKLDAQGYDAAMPVYSAVYDALVKYDKDKGIKAGLADKWSVDESGKVYEFHLKRMLNSQMVQH